MATARQQNSRFYKVIAFSFLPRQLAIVYLFRRTLHKSVPQGFSLEKNHTKGQMDGTCRPAGWRFQWQHALQYQYTRSPVSPNVEYVCLASGESENGVVSLMSMHAACRTDSSGVPALRGSLRVTFFHVRSACSWTGIFPPVSANVGVVGCKISPSGEGRNHRSFSYGWRRQQRKSGRSTDLDYANYGCSPLVVGLPSLAYRSHANPT